MCFGILPRDLLVRFLSSSKQNITENSIKINACNNIIRIDGKNCPDQTLK